MTKKYYYRNKQLTIMELTKLTGLSYDLIYSRLRAGDTVEQATRGKHERKDPKQVDLLHCIPKANSFNGKELSRQDKAIITGLIADYLQQKQRGMELLENKKTLNKMPRV